MDIIEEINNIVLDVGYVIAAFTDEYYVNEWNGEAKAHIEKNNSKLLELRIFNTGNEYKYLRSDIFKNYTYRIIKDDSIDINGVERELKYDTLEESQYLDIDTSGNNNGPGYVYTTGGGKYYLPIRGELSNAKVKIMYYLDRYSETGQVKIVDWRVAGFERGDE